MPRLTAEEERRELRRQAVLAASKLPLPPPPSSTHKASAAAKTRKVPEQRQESMAETLGRWKREAAEYEAMEKSQKGGKKKPQKK